MFYSTELLALKEHGGLGVVWLAATLGPRSNLRRITRKDFVTVDIGETCKFVAAPPEPLSLRLAATLMVGITRIYGQQCLIYHKDALSLYGNLTMTGNHSERHDRGRVLGIPNRAALKENITIKNESTVCLDNLTSDDAFMGMLDDFLANSLNIKEEEKPRGELNHYETPEAGRLLSTRSLSGGGSWGSIVPFSVMGSVPVPGFGVSTRSSSGTLGFEFEEPLNDVFNDNVIHANSPAMHERSLGHFGSSVGATPVSVSLIPQTVSQKKAKRPLDKEKVERCKRLRLFDEVTMLEVGELLLTEGEALLTLKEDQSEMLTLGDPLFIDYSIDERGDSVVSSRENNHECLISNENYEISHPGTANDGDAHVPMSPNFEDFSSGTRAAYQILGNHSVENGEYTNLILGSLPCSFEKLVSGKSSAQKVNMFYQILRLYSSHQIRCIQTDPYGPITLSNI